MLNSTTKQKINNLRDLLVGKIPNPQGQVQQITLAMIYKFMSDIDDSTNAIFAGKTFFPGEFAQYKWTHLMDSKLSAQERLNLYAEWMEKMNTNPNVPPLFRSIFKQAFLPFRDPQTLDRFLRQINELEYEHSEDLGDAYEYLLSSLSAAGDAGQFRTPRHIIDFIVQVVQPGQTDKILDPACGTAGFLISAYKYMVEHYDDLSMSQISDQIVGYDISPEMVQLALVNLYLHQFPDPKIHEYDTLTSEDRWAEKFDCILANPPFMTPKGGIQPHNKFSITSNRSEVLFVDYIIEHLRSNGKAGIIVPEGAIFQSANAYKWLRKMLIETGGLWWVISLPAGVFQPYSGVKTSILLIDKSIQTDQIIFAKITADGYDLGAQRREISKNDLPDLLTDLLALKSVIARNEAIQTENPLIWSVAKTELADDYNLSAERYKTGAVAHTGSYEMVELGEVFLEIKNGKNVNQFDGEGKYKVSRIQTIADGTVNLEKTKNTNDEVSETDFLQEWDILFSHINSIEHLAKTALFWNYQEKVVHGANLLRLRSDFTKIIPSFALSVLKSDIFIENARKFAQKAVNQASINSSIIKSLKIPLPPLEIQEQIVKELDGYQAIIDGAKQIISNWKPKIEVDSEWEMVKLGEVCEKITDWTHSTPTYLDSWIPFLRVTDITESNDSKKFISLEEHIELCKRCKPEKWDILYTKNGTIWVAKLIDRDYEFSIFVSLCLLKPKHTTILSKYLEIFMNSTNCLSQAKAHSKQWAITNLHLIEIKSFKIPLPPLDVQQSIVARIQHEQSLVDSTKKLVRIYEEKVKERVERVRSS